MNIVKLKEFIELISSGNTGTPQEVASVLGVSDRLVYYYVGILKKELKAPVVYCRKRKTYYFSEKGVLDLNWKST
jgi:hypothetical protein